jgi:hypothetical protein
LVNKDFFASHDGPVPTRQKRERARRFNVPALARRLLPSIVREGRLVDLKPDRATSEIMTYFLQHPTVADTLEGIARWRIMLQKIEQTVDETAAALRVLVKDGLIDEVKRASGEPLFRLNGRKRKEAERLVSRGVREGAE